MSKIPELMSGRKLEHSADIIGNITTQRGVVGGPAAKVGGQIGSSQLAVLTAAVATDVASVTLPIGVLTAGAVLRVKAVGVGGTGAANALTMSALIGATTFYTVTADPGLNEVVCFSADIHIGSVGATGAASGCGLAKCAGVLQTGTASAGTVNTLISNTLTFRANWAAGGETITFTNISFEVVGG